MTRHQAHRTLRIDARYLGLGLMLVSAALVVTAGWLVLSAFLGMGTYIESLPL